MSEKLPLLAMAVCSVHRLSHRPANHTEALLHGCPLVSAALLPFKVGWLLLLFASLLASNGGLPASLHWPAASAGCPGCAVLDLLEVDVVDVVDVLLLSALSPPLHFSG